MTDAFGLVRSTESNPQRVRPAGISTGRASTKGVCLNYYQFHIGDFRSGTVNMSRQSRWIYRDMLDIYYDTEKPLPLDLEVLCDALGLESAEESATVAKILRFKFIKTDDGYAHETCKRVIADYHQKADTARINGRRGGRPSKQSATDEKPIGFQSGSNPPPQSEANHKPRTINQEPTTDTASAVDVRFEKFWKAYPRKIGKDAAKRAFAKRKVNDALLAHMIAAVERQKFGEQWTKNGGQFIPHPSTWINEGRWQDEDAADVTPVTPRFAGAL